MSKSPSKNGVRIREGLTCKEIAEMLGETENVIANDLRRALKKMREYFNKEKL